MRGLPSLFSEVFKCCAQEAEISVTEPRRMSLLGEKRKRAILKAAEGEFEKHSFEGARM